MTIIEIDGHYNKPSPVDRIEIAPGQRYSVLLKADVDPTRNYWMAAR